MGSTRQITRDNHYVPQFYLKRWSKNGNTINVYNARRYVYADNQDERVVGWRPQRVDVDLFDQLDENRINWHEDITQLERGSIFFRF